MEGIFDFRQDVAPSSASQQTFVEDRSSTVLLDTPTVGRYTIDPTDTERKRAWSSVIVHGPRKDLRLYKINKCVMVGIPAVPELGSLMHCDPSWIDHRLLHHVLRSMATQMIASDLVTRQDICFLFFHRALALLTTENLSALDALWTNTMLEEPQGLIED